MFMEQNEDVDNEVHMYSLQYVFRARIDAALQKFRCAWNRHPLSSEQNLSPLQLWIRGLLASHDEEECVEVSLFISIL